MARGGKVIVVNPDVPDPIGDARTMLQTARDMIATFLERIRTKRRREWVSIGGCQRCEGTGRIVIASWGDGETDYGPCPGTIIVGDQGPPVDIDAPIIVSAEGIMARCTAQTVGPRPGAQHGGPPLLQFADEVDEHQTLDDNVRMAEDELARALSHFTPHIGATVRVHKGRKVPRGTTGVVAWTGENVTRESRYNRWQDQRTELRIGIRVNGTAHPAPLEYTAASNVYVVAPAADIDCPELWGSPKQVAWARKLRSEAIAAGRASSDDAANRTAARWWIDSYGANPGHGQERGPQSNVDSPMRKPAEAPAELLRGETGRLF